MSVLAVDRSVGYGHLHSGSSGSFDNPDQAGQLPTGEPRIIAPVKRFQIKVNDAPGVGNSYRFTLFTYQQWWVSDGLLWNQVSITISDLETEGVSVVPTRFQFFDDNTSGIKFEKLGTPGDTFAHISFTYESDGQFQIVPGAANFGSSGVEGVAGLLGPTLASAELDKFYTRKLIPISGQLKMWYVVTRGPDGIWTWEQLQIYKNGTASQDPVVSSSTGVRFPTQQATPGDWFAFTFKADSSVHKVGTMWVVTTTQFIRVSTGGEFHPDVSGAGFLSGNTGFIAPTTTPEYAAPNADSEVRSTENEVQVLVPFSFKLSTFIALLNVAPGGSRSITLTLRKNGVDTGISVTMSGFSTTNANNAAEVRVNTGDLLSIAITGANSPATQQFIAWGLRYDERLGSAEIETDLNIQGTPQATIQTVLYVAPPPTVGYAESIETEMYVKGRGQIETELYVAPATTRAIFTDMRVMANLGDGEGWSGPWHLFDRG